MELNLKRLKAERLANDITQDEMARLMGWNTRTPYAKRENGFVNVGVNEFVKMAEILGYDIESLKNFFVPIVLNREQER